MDPESVLEAERVPHGGETDRAVLDFSANTNPFVPDGVEEVYADAFSEARRYPDDGYPEFRAAAATYVDCDREYVVPTPGGLAAIRLAMETALEPGDRALVPYPSFGEYAREVRLQGATPLFVARESMLEATTNLLESCTLAVVCTPNNPTGEAADVKALERFANRCGDAGTTLLIDEAFLGFTDVSSAASSSWGPRSADHVIVARSLTKLFGLPGLRAGFAVASGDRRDRLETARRSWCLGTPAARVGAHCLEQDSFVAATRERVDRERDRMRAALETRFDVFPSDAPYLLCEAGDEDVSEIIETAIERGVAIRDARTFRSLESHFRVAVKNRERNDLALEALGIDLSSVERSGVEQSDAGQSDIEPDTEQSAVEQSDVEPTGDE